MRPSLFPDIINNRWLRWYWLGWLVEYAILLLLPAAFEIKALLVSPYFLLVPAFEMLLRIREGRFRDGVIVATWLRWGKRFCPLLLIDFAVMVWALTHYKVPIWLAVPQSLIWMAGMFIFCYGHTNFIARLERLW